MKRHRILILVYLILLLILAVFIYGFAGKLKKQKETKNKIKSLPHFSFNTLNGKVFSSEEIGAGPLVIMFFHPECEHCQYEISELIKLRPLIQEYDFLLISNADKKSVQKFIDDYSINDLSRLKVLIDEEYRFGEFFGTNTVPSTFIYGRNLKLRKSYKGEVMPEAILKFLTNADKSE